MIKNKKTCDNCNTTRQLCGVTIDVKYCDKWEPNVNCTNCLIFNPDSFLCSRWRSRCDVEGIELIKKLYDYINSCELDSATLRAKLAKRDEALWWYADKRNWRWGALDKAHIEIDHGQRAREALEAAK